MTLTSTKKKEKKKSQNEKMDNKEEWKAIEKGITQAIGNFADPKKWPEGLNSNDMQNLITQLARCAAHFREENQIVETTPFPKEEKQLKKESQERKQQEE
ncbi:MAG: hypothetical protein U9O98_07635 [Asgard group archaeon]|nr:hypothetical protein [Asgard group archaeon]